MDSIANNIPVEMKQGKIWRRKQPGRLKCSVIAIGNPGSGKSTLLNALAGEILFQSGVSFGHGITFELQKEENDRGTFLDTPGLADDTYRKAAGKAISTALREGGDFKILFFVTQQAGRAVVQDITTLRLVLEAAPEIGNQYGIIINKIPRNLGERFKIPQNSSKFLTSLFNGIEEGRRCAKTDIIYLMQTPELEAKNNQLISLDDLETLDGSSFEDRLYREVPTVKLTANAAGDINIDEFDQMTTLLLALEKKLEEDRKYYKAQEERLLAQMKRAEEENKKQRERDQQKHAEDMRRMLAQLGHEQKGPGG